MIWGWHNNEQSSREQKDDYRTSLNLGSKLAFHNSWREDNVVNKWGGWRGKGTPSHSTDRENFRCTTKVSVKDAIRTHG